MMLSVFEKIAAILPLPFRDVFLFSDLRNGYAEKHGSHLFYLASLSHIDFIY